MIANKNLIALTPIKTRSRLAATGDAGVGDL